DQIHYPGFNMTGRYYTFSQGRAQFFALDTNQGKHFNDQLTWLETSLAQSSADWKIVFGHHPVFSSGMHGSDRTLGEALTPILERHGVQLYLCGHDHNYERTVALEGVTYLVCGNGARLRPVNSSPWTAYAASRLGFTVFEVYPQHILLAAIDPEGQVFDQAIIPLIASAADI
ncbi:MAG: metallophosphoesterase, partial [Pyrinomonadaceae bacterium]|nr:metallophosphoesterase [Pyrinomonadaceae bacterium]